MIWMLFNEQEMISLCIEMGIKLIDNDRCSLCTVTRNLFDQVPDLNVNDKLSETITNKEGE